MSIKKTLIICFMCALSFLFVGCSAHIHQMGEWETKTAATCTQKEVLERECKCGYKEEKYGKNALGHKYTKKETAPTTTSNGFTTYTCACGDTYIGDKTYLVTFVSESENSTINPESLPKLNPKKIYLENEPFNGFSNTKEFKVVKYKINDKEINDIENFSFTFTKSSTVFVVWDYIKNPQVEEHTCSYGELVEKVEATPNSEGYSLYKCSCGKTEKRDIEYYISYKNIMENGTTAPFNIEADIYPESQGFAGITDGYDMLKYQIKEYRIYTSSTNYTTIDKNHVFTKSTKVTVVWEEIELTEFEKIISLIKHVEDVSAQYGEEKASSKDPQLRTMQFFRSLKYGTTGNQTMDTAWNMICGELESDFVEYLLQYSFEEMGLLLSDFVDNPDSLKLINPQTQEEVDFIHMMAVINAIHSDYTNNAFGIISGQARDLASWAGDICDLVKELKDFSGEELRTKANELFNSENSGFSKYDLAADIDAVLIMAYYNEESIGSISVAIKDYYEQVAPELELDENKNAEYTSLILGIFDDGNALKEAIQNKMESNLLINGLNDSYGINFETHEEQFNIVYELFANYLLGN